MHILKGGCSFKTKEYFTNPSGKEKPGIFCRILPLAADTQTASEIALTLLQNCDGIKRVQYLLLTFFLRKPNLKDKYGKYVRFLK